MRWEGCGEIGDGQPSHCFYGLFSKKFPDLRRRGKAPIGSRRCCSSGLLAISGSAEVSLDVLQLGAKT
jgi:hypothetical protein